MTVKVVEIRDRGTLVPALAVRLDVTEEKERRLLKHAGYGDNPETYVLLIRLTDAPYSPFAHGAARTLNVAHNYLIENFDKVEHGGVICVEHLLGERETPKTSEVNVG